LHERRRIGIQDGHSYKLDALLGLVAIALEHDQYRMAATAFVTELATQLNCERVSLGYQTRSNRVKIAALSHTATFNNRMKLVVSLTEVMSEAIDQQNNIAYPSVISQSPTIQHCHADHAQNFSATTVRTYLINDGSDSIGAITVEYLAAQAVTEEHNVLCESAAVIVGRLLEDKRRLDRALLLKMKDSFSSALGKVFGARNIALKLILMTVLGLGYFAETTPANYRVTTKAALEGRIQRSVVAPFNGYIAQSNVRAGDKVAANQTLGVLDNRDLKLEYEKLSSQLNQLNTEHWAALASHDRSAITILNARKQQFEAQMALLASKLERTAFKAPFDGIVVSGDLSQSLGATVERGEVLFEIAPLEGYRVILQVNERDVSRVKVGQVADMVLTSLPEQQLSVLVTRITPVAEAADGANVFKVEATLEKVSDELRPGMQGLAKIHVGRESLRWIWTQEMVEWFKIWWWTWMP
jgi:multidrug resistance efflux pump